MMHRKNRRRLVLVAFLGPLATAVPYARAQAAGPVIEEMRVDLWPEYDRPSTLVMYRFHLRAGANLSAPVEIPVPASAGEPHAVAWRNPQNSLFVADFTRRVEGDRAMVSAQLGSTEGQLEFYSNLTFDGPKRTFRFQWPGGVAVGSLSFQIQQPTGASAFHVTPQPSRQWVGEDGFTYARIDLGRQDAAATPSIEITYEKDSNALSAPERPPAPPVDLPRPSATPPAGASAPPTPSSASPTSPAPSSPSWLYAIGGLLMGAGASWLVWSSRVSKRPTPDSAKRTKTRKKRDPTGSARDGKNRRPRAIYCHQCGTKEDPDATFCTECGTRLLTASD